MAHYCEKCKKMLDDKEFYKSKNVEKYPPDGKLNLCKSCLTMHVDNWDPETYKWILQEVDVPYIKEEWDCLLEKWASDPSKKITGVTILGRYLSKMKLKQWNKYRWEDTDRLAEEARQEKLNQLRAQGYSGEEIDREMNADTTPPKPKSMAMPQDAVGSPEYYDPELDDEDGVGDQLTTEDKLMLRLKWGRGYRPEEWVRLEQLYVDFTNSYDVQAAGHKDTLIKICKTSLKADQLLDAGDIDGAQKMIKMYNDLMKQGNFTAAQNKGETGNFVDSIGEIVALCERDGYIERYYTDKPNDKVDMTIKDMQKYTKSLVDNETNLSELIEGAMRQITREDEAESASPDELTSDSDLTLDDIEKEIGAQVDDYQDFSDFLDDESAIDEESMKSFVGGDS